MVDRAVVAAGMDDDEWRTRLERGQKLAREAETRRRDSRDAQRTAEETIAKQAAELKRLKEEAKEARSRGGGSGRRSWRSYEVSYIDSFPLGHPMLSKPSLKPVVKGSSERNKLWFGFEDPVDCPAPDSRAQLPGQSILVLLRSHASLCRDPACPAHIHPPTLGPHPSHSSRASRRPWQTTASAS